jgi:hypothetical protein
VDKFAGNSIKLSNQQKNIFGILQLKGLNYVGRKKFCQALNLIIFSIQVRLILYTGEAASEAYHEH